MQIQMRGDLAAAPKWNYQKMKQKFAYLMIRCGALAKDNNNDKFKNNLHRTPSHRINYVLWFLKGFQPSAKVL